MLGVFNFNQSNYFLMKLPLLPSPFFLPAKSLVIIKKRRVAFTFLRYFFSVFLLIILFPAVGLAQIPGFIIQKATNEGSRVLDPNNDGYTSKTTAGFIGNDIGAGYSEISYRLFPQVLTEPHSDLKTGGSTNFTDLMENPYYAFFDGTNLLFRVRVGDNSAASKGFSVLIDADNTFAEPALTRGLSTRFY